MFTQPYYKGSSDDPHKRSAWRDCLDQTVQIILGTTSVVFLILLIVYANVEHTTNVELAKVCQLAYDYNTQFTERLLNQEITSLSFPLPVPPKDECNRCVPHHGQATWPIWISPEHICDYCDNNHVVCQANGPWGGNAWKTTYCTGQAYGTEHIKVCIPDTGLQWLWNNDYCNQTMPSGAPYHSLTTHGVSIGYDGTMMC